MELCAFQSEEKIFSPYKCGNVMCREETAHSLTHVDHPTLHSA